MKTTEQKEIKEIRGGQGQVIDPTTFRDSLSSINRDGGRKWVFPRKPKGKLTNYRSIVAYVLLAILFFLPFTRIAGNPVLQFNIIEREFFIFGQAFYPQDLFLLAVGGITSIVFIILFTVVYGRIFCGWVCPQTIFMESIFRKIEYAIEGDRNKQIKLDNQPWNSEKIMKRGLKWFIFALVSLVITHVLFMYIVGYEKVFYLVSSGPLQNMGYFIPMIIFTGLFYFIFTWFREQVCTLVCPYGRLQGVLIDKETINVYYDYNRGETRSKWRKGEDRKAAGKGDCIDCNQCVIVCPTGIDIRNGQQLECINCTICIDACNEVMEKVGLPKGLIRYATEKELEQNESFRFSIRMKAYTVFLLGLVGMLAYLLISRGEMEAKFIKAQGSSFVQRDSKIFNIYEYTFLNNSNEDKVVSIQVIEPKNAEVTLAGKQKIVLKRNKILKGTVMISFPEKEVKMTKQNVTLGVYDASGRLLDTFDTTFEGPFKMQF